MSGGTYDWGGLFCAPPARPPARCCNFALWASRYSLKGFCREAPNRGKAVTEKEKRRRGRDRRKKGRESERERGHINFTYRLRKVSEFPLPRFSSLRSQREGDRDQALLSQKTNSNKREKNCKVQLVLGTTYPKHLKNDGGEKKKTHRETHTRRKKACPEGMLNREPSTLPCNVPQPG